MSQPDSNPFNIGDRVQHSKYGTGTVDSIKGSGFNVSFDSGHSFPILPGFLQPAANDNISSIQRRLERLQRRHGGEIRGQTLFGATIDGQTGQIWESNGRLVLWTQTTSFPIEEDADLPVINPAIWHGMPVPDRQWYIPDLIPMRQVTILNGDGGVGKSLLALQIAAAGAMSIETLGLEPWAGPALYIGAEDEAEEFHRRLADIAAAHGRDLSRLHLFRLLSLADADALLSVPDKAGKMQPTPLWHDIEEFAQDYEPKLIVLDTAADLFGGDEIKRAQVRQFIGMLRKLAIELDCAVVLLAHPSVQGMQTGTGSSGSTAWNNSVRSRLYLTRDKEDDDLRILTTMKINYGKTGGEIKLRWKDGAFVLDDGKPSPAAGLLSARAERVFVEVLSKLNLQGQRLSPSPSATYAPKVIAAHPDAKGISKRELTDAMQRLLDAGTIRIVEEGPPSRKYRRLLVAAEMHGERAAA